MNALPVDLTLRCSGCATRVDPLDPTVAAPYRCPNAHRATNVDHVLVWDRIAAGSATWPDEAFVNPFVRYRTLQHSYWLGRALGGTDADHVARVGRLDAAIRSVDGTGFVITPLRPIDPASEALGVDIWAKDDTGNVAGSHKARHLMGLLLHLDVRRVSPRTPLAIASCGNAALAAATLGKAARRPVHVFVPTHANASVLDRLRALGASVTECPRVATDPPGDPCLHRFHEAVDRGALPFCVQGPENGLTIDGGTTIGHELADQLAVLGTMPDRLLVQAGGGALATATHRGLHDAVELSVIDRVPPFHVVQSEGAAPLARAWRNVCARIAHSLGWAAPARSVEADAETAARLTDTAVRTAVDEALLHAATHRSSYMWPWEDEPVSVASGILDDETYDWLAIVRAMLATGGWPVVASESQLQRAASLAGAGTDGIDTDATGAAGLAGLIALRDAGIVAEGTSALTLITGCRR